MPSQKMFFDITPHTNHCGISLVVERVQDDEVEMVESCTVWMASAANMDKALKKVRVMCEDASVRINSRIQDEQDLREHAKTIIPEEAEADQPERRKRLSTTQKKLRQQRTLGRMLKDALNLSRYCFDDSHSDVLAALAAELCTEPNKGYELLMAAAGKYREDFQVPPGGGPPGADRAFIKYTDDEVNEVLKNVPMLRAVYLINEHLMLSGDKLADTRAEALAEFARITASKIEGVEAIHLLSQAITKLIHREA